MRRPVLLELLLLERERKCVAMGNVLNLFYAGDEENMVNYDDRPRPASSPSAGESMVRSVKDVLPQVPVSMIRTDLNITSNIEESITRLVDGKIQYNPESPVRKSLAENSVGQSNATWLC